MQRTTSMQVPIPCCFVAMVFNRTLDFSQVAMHLLSEKEKNDLNQLVSTMVSYSITYKNTNSCPLGNVKEEAISDSSSLGFEPPIHDYVNFKVRIVNYIS